MLDFRTLLELAHIDPAEVLVVRHVPVEKSMKRVLPWLVVERPDLFRAYQQIQWTTVEKAIVRRQNIWRNSRRKLAEFGARLGVDVMRRACGEASADVRWSVV